ncbi:amidohydrolase family protein [Celeribacter litoreus]|uniref:amidohydrolase family protein n=1 Tax=Celeribacter litoreus TaxID=2876714 RepID=UPI001CCF835A|nr:amidohydrolase family protein [Celeribacter litoreus]
MTIDETLGTLAGADVYVVDGVISDIGANLSVPEGTEEIDASRMIVMPGMIETHWHTWTSLMRNLLSPGNEYFAVKRAFVPHMTPEAYYASDMLAFAEALNAGITTIHNYCHHVASPETVEAEMRAHQDSGLRALYTFGHRDGQPNEEPIDFALAEQVMSDWFSGSSPFEGLVDFGYNSRGPHVIGEELYRREMDWAFGNDLMTAVHAGQGRRNFAAKPMKDWGYLGPKTLLVHYVHAEAEDRAVMAEVGASLSYSIQSELRLGSAGGQAQQLVHMFNDDVNVSLSFDGNTLAQIDMFEQMATAWYMGIPFNGSSTEGLKPLDFPDVLRMGTINGAKALGIADKTGSLTVGKRADIVLLRADDLNMVPNGFVDGMLARSARAANVDTVIVDGRIMKRDGKIVGLDIDRIREDVARATFDVRKEIGDIYMPESTTAPTY